MAKLDIKLNKTTSGHAKKWGQTIFSFSTKGQQNKRQFAGLSGDVLSHFVIKYMSVVYQNDVQHNKQLTLTFYKLKPVNVILMDDFWWFTIYFL